MAKVSLLGELIELELNELVDGLTPVQLLAAIRDNVDTARLVAAVKAGNGSSVGNQVLGAVRKELRSAAVASANAKIGSGQLTVATVRRLLGDDGDTF